MDFPKPKIPTQAVLSGSGFSLKKQPPDFPSILDANHNVFVTSGRIAITLALMDAKVGDGDAVMVPAYHCSSMIEPVIQVNARPVFYRINEDTSVDFQDLVKKCSPDVKAILGTHYFGFPQDLGSLRHLCDQRGIVLIEDCAHAFFGTLGKHSIGTIGDYSIASIMKFFPVYDGGCLASRNPLDFPEITSAGRGFEIKSILNTVENSLYYGRLASLGLFLKPPLRLKDLLWERFKKRRSQSGGNIPLAPGSSDGGYGLDANWLDKSMSRFSRYVMDHSNHRKIVEARRYNFLRIHEKLSTLPNCEPLFEALPEHVVPYVYPLKVQNPQGVFHLMKKEGIPIIRFGEFLWNGVDESICPNSVYLSKTVFQFPCNQALTDTEINWMTNLIAEIITNNA
ncbi:MAG: DegT/DnrJ/EryC1/StrS family aminotransferase [Gammaproteobacteria bacterium]|nr:DegT/DnrJ/EryC1/StrS aminotransferase family protein [Pseudomonadales bacterium]